MEKSVDSVDKKCAKRLKQRRKPSSALRLKALQILDRLETLYPHPECALVHRNPFELLIATILSAQCTDVRVNMVTPPLFDRYPDPRSLARANQEDVEGLIRSTGFFRNKAANLIGCASALVGEHQAEVPQNLEALVRLPGVGRKTANVILGNAFGIPGMVVDTHVKRLTRRLGWSQNDDPVKIEQDLCLLLPAERWTITSHLLILHGRSLCKAPTPICSQCPIQPECPRYHVSRSR